MSIGRSLFLQKAYAIYESPAYRAKLAVEHSLNSMPAKWNNPDNIGHGVLGGHFFLLELYRHTSDPQVGADLDKAAKEWKEYAASVRTNNYSFFYGRMGVAYLYLQLFQLTGQERFLMDAMQLVGEYMSTDSMNLRFFEKSGLTDGVAGNLLLLAMLYKETGQGQLIDYIEQCIDRLVHNAHLSESGIYWNGLSNFDNQHIGWSHGNAGITFCLIELGHYLNSAALLSLANAALTYEKNFFPTHKPSYPGCFKTGIWAYSLVNLYATAGHDPERAAHPEDQKILDFWAASLSELIGTDRKYGCSDTIADGWAGWGLACNELYCITRNNKYLDLANRIGAHLVENLSTEKSNLATDVGFFDGVSGIGYMLLRLGRADLGSSIILPRIAHKYLPGRERTVADASPAIQADYRKINGGLARGNFKEMTAFLHRRLPLELDNYLADKKLIRMDGFVQWATDVKNTLSKDDPALSDFNRVVEKEKFFAALKDEFLYCVPDDNTRFAEKLEAIILLPKKKLLQLTLVISAKGRLFRKSGSFDMSKPLYPQILSGLFKADQNKYSFFRLSSYNELEEVDLGTRGLVAGLFIEPVTVGMSFELLWEFITRHGRSVFNDILSQFGTTDEQEIRKILLKRIMPSVINLFILGVLDLND